MTDKRNKGRVAYVCNACGARQPKWSGRCSDCGVWNAVEEIVEAPEPVVTRELEALRVEELPKDPAARLSMARAASDTGDWSDALTIYETLVNSSEMLDSVIDNLQESVRRHPDDPAGHQLLGDACMKDGRLNAALEAYRVALSRL